MSVSQTEVWLPKNVGEPDFSPAKFMPKLLIAEKGKGEERIFEVPANGAGIGRAPENAIVLASSGVSRKHASIVIEGNNCFLLDLGSPNGTFLNGARVKANEKSLLRHCDTISIENFNLRFNMIDEMLSQSFNEITESEILEVKLLKKVLKAVDKENIPSLEVLNGNFIGKKTFITGDAAEIVIGRDPNVDFPVEEYVISRKHAKVFIAEGKIFIEDLASKNGTFLNNSRITKEELHDGDRIALGTIVLMFRNPKDVNLKEISAAAKKRVKMEEEKIREEREQRTENREHETGEFEASATGSAAEEELGELEELEEPPADEYPTPQPRKEKISLSFFEIGMIGFGVLILVFATISLVNLLAR